MYLKKISLIMAIVMLIGCLQVPVFATTDLQDENSRKIFGTLAALGIIEENPENPIEPDAAVTRAEMVVMATRLLGLDSMDVSESMDTFYDVPPEHEAYSEIITAYNLGIISGAAPEKFDPQGAVTYEQAVKILVSVLGYDIVAQQMGGYPEGYLATAVKIELLDGVSIQDKTSLTLAGVARMIFNALEIDMFDTSVFHTDGNTLNNVQKGRTLLEEKFDVKTLRGTVTQNSITSLDSSLPSSKEQVAIDGELYLAGSTNIGAYLGYSATIYYKEDGSIREIVYFSDVEKYNEVLELTDKEEVEISHSASGFNLKYKEKNRTYTEFVKDAACIYNGVFVSPDEIDGENGMMQALQGKSLSVKLIDNNRDNTYDVIVIGAYTSVLVNAVSIANERITYYVYGEDRTARISELNISDDTKVDYVIYDKEENIIELKDIAPKNVISIYEDLSKKVYEIRVSTDRIKGEISMTDDNGEYTLNVVDENANTDGENIEVTYEDCFRCSPSLPEKLLKLGLKTTFYLDIDGNLAAYEMGSAVDGNYGLILDCGVKSGLGGTSEFKILTNEGNVLYFEGEKKILSYNPHTGSVEKTLITDLIDEAGNVSAEDRPYYIWLTENEEYFDRNAERSGSPVVADTNKDINNMLFFDRIWLTDEEKSDIASRKMVYYKTNSEGRISTIFVPDIPDAKYNKLTTLNGKNADSAAAPAEVPYRYNYRYISGLVYDNAAGDDKVANEKNVIRLSEDVRVFSCLALDYEAENFIVTSDTVLSGTSKMCLYGIEGSSDVRLILRYAAMPRESTTRLVPVVVKSVSENADGTYRLRGYSRAAEYDGIIAANTRLIEPQLSTSDSGYTPVKMSEMLYYINSDDGGVGLPFYDYSTYAGSTHSFADNESIKRGDIILVGKDRRNEICYVEMAVRSGNGVLLYPSTRNGFVNRMNGDTYKKGTVTGFSIWGDPLVSSVWYYDSSVGRGSTPKREYSDTFNYDKNMFHDLSKCKSIWIYDYRARAMEAASFSDIKLGDELMLDGTAFAPVDCIILRNYPDDFYMGSSEDSGESEEYYGDVNVDFYNFSNRIDMDFASQFVLLKPATKTFQGDGYSIEVGEFNTSEGANPIYLVKRPGSTQENDYCALLPNVGYTDSRIADTRAFNPRTFKVLLTNPRSGEGSKKLAIEFDYSAKANAQGNITLNNSGDVPFLTIDMGESMATIAGTELYEYPTAGGNDGFAKIQIVINRSLKTADIFVDGILKAEGVALGTEFNDLQSISFTQTADSMEKQTGDVYVDNVKIYEADTVDISVADAAPAKLYLVNDNFDRLSEGMGTLNGVESGFIPINAWWYLDGNGRKNIGITAVEEGSNDKCIAFDDAASGVAFLRFPVAPFYMGDKRTNDNAVVFEWDMKYSGELGKRFLNIAIKNDLSSPTTGKNVILNTTLGYDAGADSNENINQKWHKVVLMIDKATAEYKIYKVYTDEENKQHAIVAASGTGSVFEKMELIQFSRKVTNGTDAKAYIDNLKVYEAPESLVLGEFETVE